MVTLPHCLLNVPIHRLVRFQPWSEKLLRLAVHSAGNKQCEPSAMNGALYPDYLSMNTGRGGRKEVRTDHGADSLVRTRLLRVRTSGSSGYLHNIRPVQKASRGSGRGSRGPAPNWGTTNRHGCWGRATFSRSKVTDRNHVLQWMSSHLCTQGWHWLDSMVFKNVC